MAAFKFYAAECKRHKKLVGRPISRLWAKHIIDFFCQMRGIRSPEVEYIPGGWCYMIPPNRLGQPYRIQLSTGKGKSRVSKKDGHDWLCVVHEVAHRIDWANRQDSLHDRHFANMVDCMVAIIEVEGWIRESRRGPPSNENFDATTQKRRSARHTRNNVGRPKRAA